MAVFSLYKLLGKCFSAPMAESAYRWALERTKGEFPFIEPFCPEIAGFYKPKIVSGSEKRAENHMFGVANTV